MKTLPLVLALTLSPMLAALAMAQDRGTDAEGYQERKRFPVVRNAFRQIRNDVRYHFGTLRETASGIGHDVKSTIRGERPPRGAGQNQYGYRSVPQPASRRYPASELSRLLRGTIATARSDGRSIHRATGASQQRVCGAPDCRA